MLDGLPLIPVSSFALATVFQAGKAYHCFCSPQRLADTRKVLQKKGSNATYDRKCLGLSEGEVQQRLAAGERSVVRFKVSTRLMEAEPQAEIH